MSGLNSVVCLFISRFTRRCVSYSGRAAPSACRPPIRTATWLLDLTGDVITWRRADEPSAAQIAAPITDLLLVLYRRRPVDADGIEVTGDAGLVDFWLERVGFG